MVNRVDEGGAFEHVSSLSRGVAEAGHEVAICGPLANRADDLSVEVLPFELARPLSPARDARSIADLARIFRRFRPDLIHSHGSKSGAIARMTRFARPGAPLVHTPHGYAFAGHFSSQRERTTFKWIERSLSPLTTRILCVCEAEAALAATVCAKHKIRVVHNGIDPPASITTNPELAGLRDSGPVICVVSGLRPGKGIETLIDSLPAVLSTTPNAKIVIAGGGSEHDRLRAQAERVGVASSVLTIGEVADVYGVLAAADLFVSPSWAESFPYSILEAMALSLPIIATDVGGVGEAIEDGATGLLVPARDSVALSAAISRLLAEAGLAARLGAAAASRLRERFLLGRMVERTLAVYGELELAGDSSL
jgi:glycosyltransferase involved in cell wall biosynthesis